MQLFKFVVYQKGTIPSRTVTRKNKDTHHVTTHTTEAKDIANAVELETITQSGDLRHVLGGIFTELFNYAATVREVGARLWSLSLPIYLRFEYKGAVIDTASFDSVIADRLTFGNSPERRKSYARKNWAAINYAIMQRVPSIYLPATGEVQTTALIANVGAKVRELSAKIDSTTAALTELTANTEHNPADAKRLAKQISSWKGQLNKANALMGA